MIQSLAWLSLCLLSVISSPIIPVRKKYPQATKGEIETFKKCTDTLWAADDVNINSTVLEDSLTFFPKYIAGVVTRPKKIENVRSRLKTASAMSSYIVQFLERHPDFMEGKKGFWRSHQLRQTKLYLLFIEHMCLLMDQDPNKSNKLAAPSTIVTDLGAISAKIMWNLGVFSSLIGELQTFLECHQQNIRADCDQKLAATLEELKIVEAITDGFNSFETTIVSKDYFFLMLQERQPFDINLLVDLFKELLFDLKYFISNNEKDLEGLIDAGRLQTLKNSYDTADKLKDILKNDKFPNYVKADQGSIAHLDFIKAFNKAPLLFASLKLEVGQLETNKEKARHNMSLLFEEFDRIPNIRDQCWKLATELIDQAADKVKGVDLESLTRQIAPCLTIATPPEVPWVYPLFKNSQVVDYYLATNDSAALFFQQLSNLSKFSILEAFSFYVKYAKADGAMLQQAKIELEILDHSIKAKYQEILIQRDLHMLYVGHDYPKANELSIKVEERVETMMKELAAQAEATKRFLEDFTCTKEEKASLLVDVKSQTQNLDCLKADLKKLDHISFEEKLAETLANLTSLESLLKDSSSIDDATYKAGIGDKDIIPKDETGSPVEAEDETATPTNTAEGTRPPTETEETTTTSLEAKDETQSSIKTTKKTKSPIRDEMVSPAEIEEDIQEPSSDVSTASAKDKDKDVKTKRARHKPKDKSRSSSSTNVQKTNFNVLKEKSKETASKTKGEDHPQESEAEFDSEGSLSYSEELDIHPMLRMEEPASPKKVPVKSSAPLNGAGPEETEKKKARRGLITLLLGFWLLWP